MNITLKIILLGDTYTGKTSLMNTICKKDFSSIFVSTIGVDFNKVIQKSNINNNIFKCYIWDTSGQEKFDAIVSSYFRNINCACIIYDITKIETFLNVQKWIDKLKEDNLFENLLIFVIGNKSDLKNREVPTKDAEKFCKKNNYLFLEVSAKDKINIDKIIGNIIYNFDEELNNENIFVDKNNGKLINNLDFQQKKEYKCCNIL